MRQFVSALLTVAAISAAFFVSISSPKTAGSTALGVTLVPNAMADIWCSAPDPGIHCIVCWIDTAPIVVPGSCDPTY